MENPERVTYFAATDSRGKRVPFGIKSKDRDRHMYVIGKTGMGKSTLLENMAIQDIRNGEGLTFIDPHGGTVDHILDYIPKDRIDDVVYFAPFDMQHPIAFNVMEDVGYDKRHLVVSGLMSTFKKIWEDAWSARMEYILTNTLLALLEYPDATLLGVNRMYTDKAYRTKVIDNVKDPVVKDFWTKEFANYGDRYTQDATPAIQNKIGQFTGNPLIRNIIGQSKSSFDIRTMMDQKKILLINLSKGLVGETNMRLLGSMLTTRIFLAAMSRAEFSAHEINKLPPFYFYVDEFQNFANETFAEILSEARKYKLNLVIAHQYIEQMEEEVRDAVFGNVGTTVVFRVGPFDAEVLETIFMPRFTKEDIVALGPRQIYLSLMIDGVGSAPFSAVTIPPIEAPSVNHRDEVIANSRKQFAVEREGVEQAILAELTASLESEAPTDARMRRYTSGAKKPAPRSSAPKNMDQIIADQGTEVPGQAPVRPPEPERPTRSFTAPRENIAAPQRPLAASQNERPRRSFTAPREETAPASGTRSVPPAAGKSAEDLKTILRSMTASAGKEKQQQTAAKQQNLKGALADVLGKAAQQDMSGKTQSLPIHKPEDELPPTPARAVEPPPQKPPQAPVQNPGKPAPFEIPEDQLRAIFKEGL